VHRALENLFRLLGPVGIVGMNGKENSSLFDSDLRSACFILRMPMPTRSPVIPPTAAAPAPAGKGNNRTGRDEGPSPE